jgi:hypothetical protein
MAKKAKKRAKTGARARKKTSQISHPSKPKHISHARPDRLSEAQKRFLEGFENAETRYGAGLYSKVDRRNHSNWMAEDPKTGKPKYPLYVEAFNEIMAVLPDKTKTEMVRRGVVGITQYAGFHKGRPVEELVFHEDGSPVMVPVLDKYGEPARDPKTKRILKQQKTRPIKIKVYSDRLLIELARIHGLLKDALEVSGPGGGPITVEKLRTVYEEVEAEMERMKEQEKESGR